MSTLLLKIKANCKYLPAKDIAYADKFIANRDFESLLEIIESDIAKLSRKLNSDGLFDNEDDAKLDVTYRELAGDVISYIKAIDPDFQNDYNEYETNFSRLEGEDFDW